MSIPGLRPRSNFVNQVSNAMEVKPNLKQPNNGISVKMPNMMKQPQMMVKHKPAQTAQSSTVAEASVSPEKVQEIDLRSELARVANAIEKFTKVQEKLLKSFLKP